LVDICGYELATNLQTFTQKDLTEVKIFQKVFFWGATVFETPGIETLSYTFFDMYPQIGANSLMA